jgi:Protein of unknown function (DUF1501)/Protein of unknown function (DUF1549)
VPRFAPLATASSLALLLGAGTLPAQAPARLLPHPASVELRGAQARHRLLVSALAPDGAALGWCPSIVATSTFSWVFQHAGLQIPREIGLWQLSGDTTHVFTKLAALRIEPSDLCGDEAFVRRVYLDTIGLLPAPEEVRQFLADKAPDKRTRLIDRLLERPEFVDFWALQLGDLLQNRKESDHDVRGAKGVRSFHQWLRKQVAINRPWDELARRLVERGVRFVTVNFGGWDHHARIWDGLGRKLPEFDPGFSALLEDLDGRGLLADTLVACFGEFGRPPRINRDNGRDHWGPAASLLFAGAGVRGGQVIGATDRQGAHVTRRPVAPADVAYTIYDAVGADPHRWLMHPEGRPIEILDRGEPVRELFA